MINVENVCTSRIDGLGKRVSERGVMKEKSFLVCIIFKKVKEERFYVVKS